jgi:outer membrane protein assembly factor BamA
MRALRLCVLVISSGLCLSAQDRGIVTLSPPPGDAGNNRVRTLQSRPEPEKSQNNPVVISRISFSSALNVDSNEQDQIASLVEQQHCTADALQSCIGERIRDAFQQHGYFKAVVQPPQVTFSRVDQSEAEAVAVVSPGVRYRLGQVAWTGKYLFSEDTLNGLLAIHTGDIFDISKARETLERLRKFYSERGYINFSAVPDTEINEASQTVSLTIDIDPGRQFRLREIEIRRSDTNGSRQITKALDASGVKLGMPYNSEALQDFFDNHADLLGPGASVDQCRTDDRQPTRFGGSADLLQAEFC